MCRISEEPGSGAPPGLLPNRVVHSPESREPRPWSANRERSTTHRRRPARPEHAGPPSYRARYATTTVTFAVAPEVRDQVPLTVFAPAVDSIR
jgi:hypothetical protein